MINPAKKHETGSGLIIVILVVAFLLAIGIPLLTVTGMGPKISGSLRAHEEAFNAAEAGFDAANLAIESQFSTGGWTSFAGHYLTQPTGIDLPLDASGNPNAAYFRRKTDQELLGLFDTNGDGTADVSNLLFFRQTFATDAQGLADARVTYTVFLINEKAGGGTADPASALLVTIGVVQAGTRVLDSVRLEIQLGF